MAKWVEDTIAQIPENLTKDELCALLITIADVKLENRADVVTMFLAAMQTYCVGNNIPMNELAVALRMHAANLLQFRKTRH